MTDKLSPLARVTLDRAEELARPVPNQSLLEIYDLFFSYFVRDAEQNHVSFIEKSQPSERQLDSFNVT